MDFAFIFLSVSKVTGVLKSQGPDLQFGGVSSLSGGEIILFYFISGNSSFSVEIIVITGIIVMIYVADTYLLVGKCVVCAQRDKPYSSIGMRILLMWSNTFCE